MNRVTLFLILPFLIWAGCTNRNSDRSFVTETISKWIGREISFPDTLFCFSENRNIAFYETPLGDSSGKIIAIILGDCSDCLAELNIWNSLLSDSLKPLHAKVYFLILTSDINYFKNNFLERIPVELNCFIDTNREFYIKNPIPFDKRFQTFLLDDKNSILVIGNPINSTAVLKLYQDKINGQV